MKVVRYIVVICFMCFFCTNASAQNEEEVAIKKVIKLFFNGLQKGDITTVKKAVTDNVILQSASFNSEGVSQFKTIDFDAFLKSIASKKKEDNWDERLKSYTIQIDGNMANVWVPYEFYLNYELSHCGVNSFQLFNDGEKWKIIYLMDTRRSLGCK